MLGSIIGDIIGSTYEFKNAGRYDFDPFPLGSDFTDDTVLTLAVSDAILSKRPYGEVIHEYAVSYPNRGYGLSFRNWIHMDNTRPYGSFGNGSAMRVSPAGWAFDSLEKTIGEARKTAECTHNHPEGIKGAEAVASAVFLAGMKSSKKEIRDFIVKGAERCLLPTFHRNHSIEHIAEEPALNTNPGKKIEKSRENPLSGNPERARPESGKADTCY